MSYLHTHARRLAIVLVLVGGIAVIPALTHSARSANSHRSSSANTVSFYHQTTFLGSIDVAAGTGLDVVWKNSACSNGYGSPPAAATWTNTSTGIVGAPLIAPCGHAPGAMSMIGANDFVCEFWPWYPETRCYWTYKKSSGSGSSTSRVANPGKGTVANLYLFKRTALYAYLVAPGKPAKKISVPAGADTMTFAAPR